MLISFSRGIAGPAASCEERRGNALSHTAEVKGVKKDRGLIAAEKLPGIVFVDGDPTKNIRDLDKLATVIKGGKVYDPAAIEKALGITARK